MRAVHSACLRSLPTNRSWSPSLLLALFYHFLSALEKRLPTFTGSMWADDVMTTWCIVLRLLWFVCLGSHRLHEIRKHRYFSIFSPLENEWLRLCLIYRFCAVEIVQVVLIESIAGSSCTMLNVFVFSWLLDYLGFRTGRENELSRWDTIGCCHAGLSTLYHICSGSLWSDKSSAESCRGCMFVVTDLVWLNFTDTLVSFALESCIILCWLHSRSWCTTCSLMIWGNILNLHVLLFAESIERLVKSLLSSRDTSFRPGFCKSSCYWFAICFFLEFHGLFIVGFHEIIEIFKWLLLTIADSWNLNF